jgi:hypothetical protein
MGALGVGSGMVVSWMDFAGARDGAENGIGCEGLVGDFFSHQLKGKLLNLVTGAQSPNGSTFRIQ